MTLSQILPYLGGGVGVVTLSLALLYKQPVTEMMQAWAASKRGVTDDKLNGQRDLERAQLMSDVEKMRTELANHMVREESYWHMYDAKLVDLTKRIDDNDERYRDIKATMDRQHESLVGSIQQLTAALMTHMDKGN